ncbi:hypothetical protein AAHC03_020851 [Spirometra sp. Aus1]
MKFRSCSKRIHEATAYVHSRKILLLGILANTILPALTYPQHLLSDEKLQISQLKRNLPETIPLGNSCPVTAPWPCQQPTFCLPFAFLCDGEIDCPDGYDENPRMCVAKNRPAVILLEGFITKYRDWLVPKYLGNGSAKTIAYNLAVSQSIDDYAQSMQLDEEQTKNLTRLLTEVLKGRQIALLMLGMPLQSWSEVYVILRPIAQDLCSSISSNK